MEVLGLILTSVSDNENIKIMKTFGIMTTSNLKTGIEQAPKKSTKYYEVVVDVIVENCTGALPCNAARYLKE
jgi:hypothetical protein